MDPEVSIVLSTFNGAAYVAEQLDSLLEQSYPNVTVCVRDDGSNDSTGAILKRYAARHRGIEVRFGERLGITRSFFELLQHSGEGGRSEYFAFCDQDDVWRPDKVERAVSSLSALPSTVPALYCSRVEYVDAELEHLGYSRLPRRDLEFRNALVENCATGCTVVLNRAARDLVVGHVPTARVWHDWWCYLVVSAFGTVVYDEAATVKYRQHAGNDTGAPVSSAERAARRLRRLWRKRDRAFRSHAQAREFASIYAPRLSAERRQVVERFVGSKENLPARIRLALDPGVFRQARLDNLALRAMIVIGWY